MKTLVSMIESVKGCQFANIMFVADGGIPKKVINGNVQKLVSTRVQINYSYENAVNNRLAKQGEERTFVAQSLPWGSWVKGQENKLIEHKGNLYLRYYEYKGADYRQMWFVDGVEANPIQFRAIIDYLESKKKKSSSNRQTESGLTENQVKPKLAKVSEILKLNVNGEEWKKKNDYEKAFEKAFV
jgi:hypothetical protein